MWHVVLTKAEERPNGRMALTYAIAPGKRVTVVSDTATLDEELTAHIAAVVAPLLQLRQPAQEETS